MRRGRRGRPSRWTTGAAWALALAPALAGGASLPAGAPESGLGTAPAQARELEHRLAAARDTTPERRALALSDYLRHRRVSDVQVSPDGERVAFVRREIDLEEDRWRSAIWEAPVDGSDAARRLTYSEEGEGSPRWSPDGRWLAFLSSRGEGEGSQIWVLPARGGEAVQATRLPGGVSSYVWAPGGRRFAVVARDTAVDRTPLVEGGPEFDDETPAPYVITRLQFLRDGSGYVGERRRRIHVVDFRPGELPADGSRVVTPGPWDASDPTWSPDGRWIAFASNRTADPDTNDRVDLWAVAADPSTVEAGKGATEEDEAAGPGAGVIRLTPGPGTNGSPAWSPDGNRIAYRYTPADPPVYAAARLRTVAVEWTEGRPAPGKVSTLTEGLDRPLRGAPVWSPEGAELYVRIQDRGTEPLLRVDLEGEAEPVLAPSAVVSGFSLAPQQSRVAAILSWGTRPEEVFSAPLEAVEGAVPMRGDDAHASSDGRPGVDGLRNLSGANDPWLREVRLLEPRPLRWTSPDGTPVEGWVIVPEEGEGPHPLVVKIHGGPVAQYTWAYDFERQWWAAQGYAVLYTNPRGSSGYGEAFAHALWQDWGGPDYEDVMAGVDLLVEEGIADPERMAVGGWSYGGILTNYIVVKTDRFRAGISGASETFYRALYGTDDLQRWWEDELGLPWENPELYEELSPLNRFTEIRTPLLLVSGEEDRRIPVGQSEMLYIRLKRTGVPTGLIVYPGQSHGIGRPSYQIDRFERYRAWLARHVLGDEEADPFFGRRSW